MALAIERRVGAPDNRPLCTRVCSLLVESDTTTVRFLLTMFAFAQAAGFFLQDDCYLPACQFLGEALSYHAWGALFLAYGCAKTWRIFDGKPRYTLAKVINGFGACIFGGLTTAVLVARWPFWILAVPYIVLSLAAVWVFARTAINSGRGFRDD